MDYVLFFFEMIFYTVGAAIICGLVVGLCERLVLYLMGPGAGRGVVIGTSFIGTPIHELSHAIMCLIFGHKIQKIVLWQPSSYDGTLGYVSHTYHPRNLYHKLGNLFIGIGPIFGGMGVILLMMSLCFPVTLDGYFASVSGMVRTGEGVGNIFLEGLKILPQMFKEFSFSAVPAWIRILALIVMLSVSLHINLSTADIKGAATAIPIYLVLALIPTIIISLVGRAAMGRTREALQIYSATMFALFTLVFVFVLFQILIALVIYMIRRCANKR